MTDNNYNEKQLALEVDGYSIPAAITSPTRGTLRWGIVIIPGSLFSDVDGNFPSWNWYPNSYGDLAKQLAAQGHAVIRYAKIGPGTGSVVIDQEKAAVHSHFSERVVVAKQAFETLTETFPEIQNWALAGYSEGSLVGSLLCQQLGNRVNAYINLSGPFFRFFDLMMRQQEAQDPNNPSNQAYRSAVEIFRRGELVPAELKADPMVDRMFGYLDQGGEGARTYMREMDAVDPAAEFKKVACPALLVQGGLDSSVFSENSGMLREARQGLPTDSVFFPELTHFYKQATPEMPAQEAAMLSGETDPRVSESISRWLEGLGG